MIEEKYERLMDYWLYGRGEVDCEEIKSLGHILEKLSKSNIKRNIANMYLIAPQEFDGIEGVVSYEIIWCTGNEFYKYKEIAKPSELVSDLSVADCAGIIKFEGRKLLLIAERY